MNLTTDDIANIRIACCSRGEKWDTMAIESCDDTSREHARQMAAKYKGLSKSLASVCVGDTLTITKRAE